MRAFQFFNLNKEEDRQEFLTERNRFALLGRPFLAIFLTLASDFLDTLIGGIRSGQMDLNSDQIKDFLGLTRPDVDIRRKGNILSVLGNILGNLLGLLDSTGILEGIFDSRALMPNEYNFDQFDPLLGFLPEFILLKIADLVATPCLFANLIAADNELLGDACEFFQNLDE